MPWGKESTPSHASGPTRFYPFRGAKDVDFVLRIQDQFPFIIADGTNAVITSGLTMGTP